MKPFSRLTTLRKWNIWQRPIRRNDLFAIMNEAGFMAAEFVLWNFLRFLLIPFEVDKLRFSLVGILTVLFFGYIAGAFLGLGLVAIVSIFGKYRNRAAYVASAISIPVILIFCLLDQYNIWRFFTAYASLSNGLYLIYCGLLILAGRFGAKLFEVTEPIPVQRKVSSEYR